MDIEPLWALGGWFLFSNCMATPKAHSTVTETCTKSRHFFLLFALLFILLLLITNPTNTIKDPSNMAPSSISIKRLLLESSESASTTMNLHPNQPQNTHTSSSSSKSKHKEFGVQAHEVPSGPNPISN
uniref:Uncharacterized protein n=1 Tax=Rhizophora mucronata TaxID=61149 RepID=A0A2P2PTH2_RHIMU